MTGKRYYITTFADWQRHAERFANSHWVALEDKFGANAAAPMAIAEDSKPATNVAARHAGQTEAVAEGRPGRPVASTHLYAATQILVLVEADEGAHLALEDDSAFEPLPHPLAQQPISEAAHAALAALGVAANATTFEAAEAAARVHPLLRHRVF